MPEFVWEARARGGEMRKGVMDAETEDGVLSRLRQQSLTPVKVKKKPKEFNIAFGRGVTDKEIVTFTRQFATMIDAGLPLVQCLEILGNQSDNKAFQRVIRDVKTTVEGGATFSEALKKHPKLFDDLFVNLVAAGEAGGVLDTVLNRLATYIEKRLKLIRQVRSALVYPAGIAIVAVLVMGVLLGYVIPQFQRMFADFGASDELPALTQLVIDLSNAFLSNFIFIALGLIAIVVTVVYSYRRPKGKFFWHTVMLQIPLIGPVLRKIAVSRFTRTMGTLLSSGVPILDAMDICARSAGNVVIEKGIRYARDRISEGKGMAEPLLETKVFPPMVVQMIAVGEQTGALDQMLQKIADFYEEEVDMAVEALTSALEPIMMVGIGGMVGVMLIAMYLPIFDLAGKVQTH
ncbi:MAG: type II secretion system F family protein [Deltaproteobacteria bacterium]|nr:type II secretion system F family protein [Deltaproteobacteria bacterium]